MSKIRIMRSNGTYVAKPLNAPATVEDVISIVNATLGRHLAVRHSPWHKRLFARLRSKRRVVSQEPTREP
jgi:hypothetical protein